MLKKKVTLNSPASRKALTSWIHFSFCYWNRNQSIWWSTKSLFYIESEFWKVDCSLSVMNDAWNITVQKPSAESVQSASHLVQFHFHFVKAFVNLQNQSESFFFFPTLLIHYMDPTHWVLADAFKFGFWDSQINPRYKSKIIFWFALKVLPVVYKSLLCFFFQPKSSVVF